MPGRPMQRLARERECRGPPEAQARTGLVLGARLRAPPEQAAPGPAFVRGWRGVGVIASSNRPRVAQLLRSPPSLQGRALKKAATLSKGSLPRVRAGRADFYCQVFCAMLHFLQQ